MLDWILLGIISVNNIYEKLKKIWYKVKDALTYKMKCLIK